LRIFLKDIPLADMSANPQSFKKFMVSDSVYLFLLYLELLDLISDLYQMPVILRHM
jgi:hypothetical protein